MLLTYSEDTLRCATDFRNPKLFSSMEMCIQNLNFKAKVHYSNFAIGLQKYCIKMKFWIFIWIELNNLGL